MQPLGSDRSGELTSGSLIRDVERTLCEVVGGEDDVSVVEIDVKQLSSFVEQDSTSDEHVILNTRRQYDLVTENFEAADVQTVVCDGGAWEPSGRLRSALRELGCEDVRSVLDLNDDMPDIIKRQSTTWTLAPSTEPFCETLVNTEMGCELVLFRGNHGSLSLSSECARKIAELEPDVVILETDSTRLERLMFPPPFWKDERVMLTASVGLLAFASPTLAPLLAPAAMMAAGVVLIRRMASDMSLAVKAAGSAGAHVVLADWHVHSRGLFSALARSFDSVQYSNQADEASGHIFWKALFQAIYPLPVPSTTSSSFLSISRDVWDRWRAFEKEKNPHTYYIFETRNDMMTWACEKVAVAVAASSSVAAPTNDEDRELRRIFLVAGAAHVDPIIDRLTNSAVTAYDPPFSEEGTCDGRIAMHPRDYPNARVPGIY